MKLSIFDFDGTLVRPSGRWNSEIVEQMRKALDRGDYVVVLTGRPGLYSAEIRAALLGQQVFPNEIIAVGPIGTLDRKKKQIRRLVDATGAKNVAMWDDNGAMLSAYGKMLTDLHVPARLQWVR